MESKRSGATGMAGVAPRVLSVRVPGKDYDIRLGDERWRCRVLRTEPALIALTKVCSLGPVGLDGEG
jgi:hypothetical protein